MTRERHLEDLDGQLSQGHAYLGVVLALDQTPSGRAAYRVKLWHGEDAALTVCLLETFEGDDILAQWTRWALHFDLPKFIERAPGQLEAAEQAPGQPQCPRRRGAGLANRRPGGLLRRSAPFSQATLAG